VGGVEQEADLFAEVDELETTAFPARGDVEARQSAETHAVHADQIGQVEDDALVMRQQRPDLVVEDVADTGHEFAVQSDDDGVRVAIDVERQDGCGLGHRMFLAAKVGEAGPFSHALQCGIAKLITLANSCPIDLIIAAFWQAPSEARLSCSGDNSLIHRISSLQDGYV